MKSVKRALGVAALLLLAGSGSLLASLDAAYQSRMSFGLMYAERLAYGYTDPAGNEKEWKADDAAAVNRFFGLTGRMFLTKNIGVGLDMLLLDWETYEGQSTTTGTGYDGYGYYQYIYTENTTTDVSKWLIDLDVIYRMAVTPKILVNGGIGFTYEMLYWETTDGSGYTQTGSDIGPDIGFNMKLGGEYKLDQVFSVTADWKWQYWPTGIGKEKYSIHSFALGINYNM